MNNTNTPLALKLADELETCWGTDSREAKAAAELRRLQAEAEELKQALKLEHPADEHQSFIDSLPNDSEDKMLMQIDHWARQSYQHWKRQVRGQQICADDRYESHIIWAALRWAKENASQQPAEPVVWMTHTEGMMPLFHKTREQALNWQVRPTPLYTTPQPAAWVGLTDEELRDALREYPHDTIENLRVRWLYAKDFARAIEAKLREKNGGWCVFTKYTPA